MGLLEHVASAIKAYRYHMVAVCLIFFLIKEHGSEYQ